MVMVVMVVVVVEAEVVMEIKPEVMRHGCCVGVCACVRVCQVKETEGGGVWLCVGG